MRHSSRPHLGWLLLVTVAIALIMTPAAYDRIVDESRITRGFITLASRVISTAMVPLMLVLRWRFILSAARAREASDPTHQQ